MGAVGTRSHPETSEEIAAEQELIAAMERIQWNQLGETGIRLGLNKDKTK